MNGFHAPFLFPTFRRHLYHHHCYHSHPSHRHRLSELKKSPGWCPYSHLAYLQLVSSTGPRVCTKFSSDQKFSSDATDGFPMDKITNLPQDLKSLISLTWPDLVSYRCPGSLCSGHPWVLAIPHDRLSHSSCRTLHRLFPQPECSSPRCWWGSFFYLIKASAKLSPHRGHHPWHPVPLLSLPCLGFTFFISFTRIQHILYLYICLLIIPPLGPTPGCSINILVEWASVAIFLKWRQCSPSQDY